VRERVLGDREMNQNRAGAVRSPSPHDAITLKLGEALPWLRETESWELEMDVTAGRALTGDPASGLVGGSGMLAVGLVRDGGLGGLEDWVCRGT
jgi:hypothetical protein